MKLSSLCLLAPMIAASASCTSDGASGPQPLMVSSDPFTLQPGEEKYYCYTQTLTEDTVVTGFEPIYGEGTHHIILAQSLVSEPEGFSECNVLFKNTWIPLYLGGKNSTAVNFPEGAGYRLDKGTSVILQLHLQNPSDKAVTATTKMKVTTIDPTTEFVPAGVFGLDHRGFKIPAHSTGFKTEMTCDSHGKTLDVFSTFAHMHKYGTHLTVTRNESETVFDGAWNFDEQTTVPKTMKLLPTDTLKLNCTYNNATANEIKYGESSDDEMCAFVLYYTPFDALDGCIGE